MTVADDVIRARLREVCRQAGGQRAWCRSVGENQSYVSEVILGRRPVSDRLAALLGFEKVVTVTYQEKQQGPASDGEEGETRGVEAERAA